MKKLVLGIFVLTLSLQAGWAQVESLKVGHVSVEYVLGQMPEMKAVNADLADYEKQLQNQIQAKQEEFRRKLTEYQENAENMIDAIRADKEQELEGLQRSLQQFQVNAERSLQNKQAELMQPLIEKVEKAINEVAEEQNYTHIFRSEALVFAKDTEGISKAVLLKLGVDPNAATSTEAQ